MAGFVSLLRYGPRHPIGATRDAVAALVTLQGGSSALGPGGLPTDAPPPSAAKRDIVVVRYEQQFE